MRAAVLGAGSWGTTFAQVLADAGADVMLWARRPELAAQITADHRNSTYLPQTVLPEAVRATSDPASALAGAEVVVLALPAQTLCDNVRAWRPLLPPDVPVVSLMKGVELGSSRRMSEVIVQEAGVRPSRVVVISGPNLAPEIAQRQPAASVVACVDEAAAETVAELSATAYLRPYTTRDVVGTEVAGAVKNVVALAVGMAEGLGLGDNAKASLLTRGLAETARLGEALGAESATFTGLAGVGDLIATCMSPLSRNRTAGVALGRGTDVRTVVAGTGQVAEGVTSCRAILHLARRNGVDMPIVAGVVAVVHEGRSPLDTGLALLERARRPEREP